MKALIRNPGETVRETDGILGIDWDTGAPLTNAAWCGGSYALVLDWKEEPDVEDTEPADDEICTRVAEVPETPKVRTFVINGVEYTEQELKNLLIAE